MQQFQYRKECIYMKCKYEQNIRVEIISKVQIQNIHNARNVTRLTVLMAELILTFTECMLHCYHSTYLLNCFHAVC